MNNWMGVLLTLIVFFGIMFIAYYLDEIRKSIDKLNK